ncbi:hypothetical protein [Sodalis glossinidius]|uniref:hypothetical protein n=1 Tax=Sodalis glossinidius TaxID=63612 RepID=UPI00067FAFA1|nr:hypothetical protein [Sodalis glossinidius]
MPDSSAIAVDVLFSLYNSSKFQYRPTLALNFKADGLQKLVREKLNYYHIQNYFLFDMSIPDLLTYKNEGLKFFIRFSKYEPEFALLEDAARVWLDGFKETILDEALIISLLICNKKFCLVSPELHARAHFPVWEIIKRLPDSILLSKNFLLCIDLSEDATRFFYCN